jgi:hypothetical protein
MTISDRFKAELQAGNLAAAFELAFTQAMELEIITRVTGSDDSQTDSQATSDRTQQMRSHFSFIAGRIENEIGPVFLEGEAYAALRQNHFSQVKDAHNTLQAHLKNLRLLMESWSMLQRLHPQPLSEPKSLSLPLEATSESRQIERSQLAAEAASAAASSADTMVQDLFVAQSEPSIEDLISDLFAAPPTATHNQDIESLTPPVRSVMAQQPPMSHQTTGELAEPDSASDSLSDALNQFADSISAPPLKLEASPDLPYFERS